MKKLLAGLLVGVMAFSFSACGDSFEKVGRNVVDPNFDTSSKIDLNILLPYVSTTMESNGAIALLDEITSYKTTYSQAPIGAAAESEINNIFTSKNNTYNAIKLTKNQFNRRAVNTADIADLTEVVNSPKFKTLKDSISQEAWDSVTYDGKILGIPDSSSNNNIDKSIIIRKDIMYTLTNPATNEKYTEVPTTFEEFKTLLEVFKESTGSSTAFTLTQNLQVVGPIASSFGVEQMWQDVNGELVFAAENENFPSYVSAMKDLYTDGLIDRNVQTNTIATCVDKFASGDSIATVTNFWEMGQIATKLEDNGKSYKNAVDFAVAFENEDGKMKTFQSGGTTYVTVIPNWKADTGTYVMDYVQEKIQPENFKKLVVGTEGTDYGYDDLLEEFYPYEGFSAKKMSADQFVTGTNDTIYGKYWTEVVVKGTETTYFQWQATNTEAFANGLVGVMNPVQKAPPLATYSKMAAGIEDKFNSDVTIAIYGSGKVEDVKANFLSSENTEAINEIKNWYKNK